MSDAAFARNLAAEHRRRLVASILESYEKKVLPLIPAEQRDAVSKQFREKVLSSVGRYHDFFLDCLTALSSTNEG